MCGDGVNSPVVLQALPRACCLRLHVAVAGRRVATPRWVLPKWIVSQTAPLLTAFPVNMNRVVGRCIGCPCHCQAGALIRGALPAQIVMEGMLKIRLRPWVRRMFTRTFAIVPAAVVAGVYGAAGAGRLLVLSQVRLDERQQF